MIPDSVAIVIVVVLLALAGVAVAKLLRGLARSSRMAGEGEPYVPFEDTTPPDPVVRTARLVGVAWAVLVWAAANLALAVVVWSMAGMWVGRELHTSIAGIYVAVAALLVGAGGVMLLGGKAYGRRMVSWGSFLLGILTFLGAALALLLPAQKAVPENIRNASVYVAIGLGAHVLITTVVGSMAQTAGRPVPDGGQAPGDAGTD